MKPQSAKAKGRKLQQYVRDEILVYFPELEEDDVKSTGMGQQGEDVQLSPKARAVLQGISIECKSLARIAAYRYYEQAKEHGKGRPVVVMKENNSKPLVLIDFSFFMELLQR